MRQQRWPGDRSPAGAGHLPAEFRRAAGRPNWLDVETQAFKRSANECAELQLVAQGRMGTRAGLRVDRLAGSSAGRSRALDPVLSRAKLGKNYDPATVANRVFPHYGVPKVAPGRPEGTR